MALFRALPGIVAALLLAATAAATAAAAADRPNVVLIVTDDEDVAIHKTMPKTRALIADQGARFDNFFVSYAWCCPSRTSILRGQYAHNTGVVSNEPPLGGYETLHRLGLEDSTLATWLQGAGYRTAMIGKYINRYEPRDGVPPGWSEWYVGGNAHVSYDYVLNENGRLVEYGDAPGDYLNDVLTDKAVGVIGRAAAAGEPFFVYVLPYVPHSPAVAAPRHVGMFADAKLPRTPSFDEADMSDKPAIMRRLPRIDAARFASMQDEYRRRLASLLAVDDMVGEIVAALEETGTLDETYFIYTSDNGFHMGEHRMNAGKVSPYEEDIRVPMAIRGPGVAKGTRVDALAVNIDLAPTIAAIAGVEAPDFVDGRSFLPLLADARAPWRRSFLIERRVHDDTLWRLAEASGATKQEVAASARFEGLRTAGWSYVEYATGERELYDLVADPFQLVNVADSVPPESLAALSARLADLAACAGPRCRQIEDLPVDVPPRAVATDGDSGPTLRATPAAVTR